MESNFEFAKWINKPKKFEIDTQAVKITTEPDTDLWQRTYYGFKRDNAPALLIEENSNFTFTARATFEYEARFDQCGLIVYLNTDYWFKASIEYENSEISRLGSVVTSYGYSDWSTIDITPTTTIWYRLSRRGSDFLIEFSENGISFKQMRIFHLHSLDKTLLKQRSLSDSQSQQYINYGLYACSPSNSSFKAKFDNFKFDECKWMAHT